MSNEDFKKETSKSFYSKTSETSEFDNSETSPIEDTFSKIIGFDPESETSNEENSTTFALKKSSPLLSDEEMEAQITRHSFASSPLSKLVLVAGGMFVIILLMSLFISSMQSKSDNSVSATKSGDKPKEKQSSKLLSEQSPDKEKGELLSELALKDQKERLKLLQKNKLQRKNSGQKPLQTTTVSTNTTTPSATPIPTRTISTPSRQPQSQIRNVPPQAAVQVPILRSPSPLIAQTNPTTTQTDSSQSWKQLSEVGSFGGGSNNGNSSGNGNGGSSYYPSQGGRGTSVTYSFNNQNPQQRPGASYEPKPFTTTNNQTTENSLPSIPTNGNDPQAIIFGQSVSGILQNTIAWENSYNFSNNQNTKSDDQYVVTLNQSLKDKSGKEQIPAGSQLIVRVDGKTTALVNLTAEAVIINGVTTQLPQGVLKIRSSDGQPLVAELKTIGGNNGGNDNSFLDILSLANIPGLSSLSGASRLLGGNRNGYGYGSSVNIYYLQQGRDLQIFVNKPFAIKTSPTIQQDEPLQLNILLKIKQKVKK